MRTIPAARVFDFETDTFAYPNELVWEYHLDQKTGKSRNEKRNPPPTYAHHCFVVVRSARQFFRNVEFSLHGTVLSDVEYLDRIKAVAQSCPREGVGVVEKTEIPGFANLREFSQARPDLLKSGCGGAWQSYAQRGNWRMVFPFTRGGQRKMAGKLAAAIAEGQLPIVHVATFPSLTINHTILLYRAAALGKSWEFCAYDPNICDCPLTLTWDAADESFHFPRTHYFAGGWVNAYEIYCGRFF